MNVRPFEADGCIVWRAGLSICVDGAPNAYCDPARTDLSPLDDIRNAQNHLGRWVGIAVDDMGEPYVQNALDPFPGYYVSTTALTVHGRAESDPKRYCDASVVPYLVLPPELGAKGVRLGDVAMVTYEERQVGAILADIGNPGGSEGSICLAIALGIPNCSPINGGVSSGVSVVIFPRSRCGWPRPISDFQRQASGLFQSWGGQSKVNEVIAAFTGV